MNTRSFLFIFVLIFAYGGNSAFARDVEYVSLSGEPLIRIGLLTNASSVNITTGDSSLVAVSPDEPMRLLTTTRVTVSAQAYRPSEVDFYRLEFQGLQSKEDADALAKDIRESAGESAIVSSDQSGAIWTVWVGGLKESEIEIEELKVKLAEKGFEDAVTVTEKKTVVSDEAIALSNQVRNAGKSEVRSLIRPTGSALPIGPAVVAPNLREVIVNGPSENAKYSSLKAVAFGSLNERLNPVRLNGKAYRGKIEVFVNARGTLTAVNVVPLEEYLLGVVPAELSLPQLEAQKAQAVAARTYAIANIGTYGKQGFDMVPTVWSQVYKGVSIESKMGTQAVRETSGIIATYKGKPITAYYTSTCGGRTEDGNNIFEGSGPYLRGVECSLEGRRHFEPFMIKTSREPAKLRDDGNLELARLMSNFAANGFLLSAERMTDDWFEDVPEPQEVSNWLQHVASRFGKPLPPVNAETAKPIVLAQILAGFMYGPGEADTLMSDSDINYQLAFDDASEIPKERRADLAMLFRDGYFNIHPDLTFKPQRHLSRAKMIRLLALIYEKRKWMPTSAIGVTKATVDGKLVVRIGRADRQFPVRPDVFLFRQFGNALHPVREAALIGGEEVTYQLDALGAVKYLEIKPSPAPTVAENMSPFTNWRVTVPASAVQQRLSRYVRGIGTLYDVNIKQKGYSRRATELEIVGSNGVKTLKGGSIRSALRLREQLFVIEKRYSGDRVTSYIFTGRGWGHGVGMCQYGAYGLAKMGVKYDEIVRHYYSGVELAKAY